MEDEHKTTVVNVRKEKYDVYIGRYNGRYSGMNPEKGYFGNPFPVGIFGLEQCLRTFKYYFDFRIATDPEFKRRILELKGKSLGCFCVDSPVDNIREHKVCHGEIIKEYLDGQK